MFSYLYTAILPDKQIKNQPLSGWFGIMCARHGAHLGGVSPLLALSMGIMSLCKGVHREVKSEGSKWRILVVTNRNHIVGYYIG